MKRLPLSDEYAAIALDAPLVLLDDAHASLRATIVEVSDEAFGTSTERLWREKFTPEYLGSLTRFYLLVGAGEELVGWSGYRAHTIEGERIVYFTSTGLLPRCQGAGLVPAVQRAAVAYEARRHPFRRVSLVVRTRNPHAYRLAVRTFGNRPVAPALDGTVPRDRRRVIAGIAAWLGLEVDPATALVRNAYEVEDSLYGEERQSGDAAVNALFDQLAPRDALLVLGCRTRLSTLALAVRRVTSPGRRTAEGRASAP